MDNSKKKKLRSGSYYTFTAMFVIAILVVVNLIAGKINKNIDLTDKQLYSLSDESKAILSAVNEDITIYKLFKTGSNEEIITTVNEILANYTTECPHINIQERDPYIHPKFVEGYRTTEDIPVNSLIVEKGNRFRVIKPSQFYDKSIVTGEDVLDIEGQITNAVIYVSLDKTPVIGYVTGHNEDKMPENIKTKMEFAGYEIEDIELAKCEKVPEECDFLMITSPDSDYSVHEADIINDFLANDGRAMICLDFAAAEKPILESVLNGYGVETTNAIIREDDPKNYYAGDADILIPNVANSDVTSLFYQKGFAPRMKFPQPLKSREVQKTTLNLEAVLTTSASSSCRYNDNRESAAYAEGDEKGPFTVAYAVTDSTYTDTQHITKIIAIGSSAFLDDGMDTSTGGFNSSFVSECFKWLNDNSTEIYISPKSLEITEAEVNGSDEFGITLFVCGIIPFGILLIGFIVWLKRRNK